MYLNSCYRDTSEDKANLFNKYFCDQFSDKSNYNIPIDYANDNTFDISLYHAKIQKLLSNINYNKASA